MTTPRERERTAGTALRELLEVLAKEHELLEREIDELLASLFIETSDAWAIPYIGDLVELHLARRRRRARDLRRAIADRFEHDVRSIPRDWWPGGPAREALDLRWKLGAAGAARHDGFRDATFRSLRGSWRAFRGARIPREAYDRVLRRAVPLLDPLEDVTIADFRAGAHLDALLPVFRVVSELKPTRAKWVSTSKTLYFLLPDLVPPIDNAFTVPFVRRAGIRMPLGIERDALGEVFGLLSSLARVVGPARLRALSEDGRYATPIGMARVVDFAIAARLVSPGSGSARARSRLPDGPAPPRPPRRRRRA